MDDERDDDLIDESALFDEPEPFEQDGPDLFGMLDEPDVAPAEPAVAFDTEELPSDAVVEALEAAREPEPDPAAMRRPEAPLALYRRYRPDTFADVIGQEHVTEPLQRALVNNRVNHAYLFLGPARLWQNDVGPHSRPGAELRQGSFPRAVRAVSVVP